MGKLAICTEDITVCIVAESSFGDGTCHLCIDVAFSVGGFFHDISFAGDVELGFLCPVRSYI